MDLLIIKMKNTRLKAELFNYDGMGKHTMQIFFKHYKGINSVCKLSSNLSSKKINNLNICYNTCIHTHLGFVSLSFFKNSANHVF